MLATLQRLFVEHSRPLGWKTTSVFHRYAIVDNQDIADAMDMLEKSQDAQRQRLGGIFAAKENQSAAISESSQPNPPQPETPASSPQSLAGTSRLHHIEVSREILGRLHRGTARACKAVNYGGLTVGAGRGSRTPKGRSPADFESAASASSAIPA